MNMLLRSLRSPAVLACLLWLSSPLARAQEGEEVLRKEALSDPSPGAFSQPRGTHWTLLSTEEGGKLLGRVTWADPLRTKIFELEAAATLQKGAEEVELLNADGLAGGDSSIKAKWSWSDSRPRRGKTVSQGEGGGAYISLCESLNAALEHQLASHRRSACSECDHCGTPDRCAAASHEFELLAIESCTLDELDEIGGEWPSAAQKADRDALQAACDELAKVDPTLTFHPAGFERFPHGSHPSSGARLCTEEDLAEAARAMDKAYDNKIEKTLSELNQEEGRLEKDEEELVAELARLDAAFAEASAREELERIAAERYAKRKALESLGEKIAGIEAKQEAATKKPPLISDLDKWLEEKRKEKLAAVCKSYNQPDRSNQFPLFSEEGNCHTVKIPESIAAIEDRALRSAFYKRFLSEIPVAIWYLTFSAGASNKDFEFVDPESVAGVETFAEVEDLLMKENEIDTMLGVTWSSQIGNHFFSVGYERRNKHSSGDSTEVCASIEADGVVTRCIETTAGAPKRIDQNLGLVEWRTYVTGGLGLKLRAFYIDDDFRRGTAIENEWEFHALLYFLPHKEKGLNGGLDIGYDTAFEDTTARVFIGQSFDIFN